MRRSSPVIVLSLLVLILALGTSTVGNSKRDNRTIFGAIQYVIGGELPTWYNVILRHNGTYTFSNIKEWRISLWWFVCKIVPLSYTKPRVTNHGSSLFWKCALPVMSKTSQNMPGTSNLCYHPLTDWLLGVAIGNQEHSVMDLQLL